MRLANLGTSIERTRDGFPRYVGIPRFIPWALQQPILEEWAATEFVKIWGISEDSVKPGLMNLGLTGCMDFPVAQWCPFFLFWKGSPLNSTNPPNKKQDDLLLGLDGFGRFNGT